MDDANRMIKACEDNGVPLSVGHTKSWDPMYHKIRDMVRDRGIGQVKSITATMGSWWANARACALVVTTA